MVSLGLLRRKCRGGLERFQSLVFLVISHSLPVGIRVGLGRLNHNWLKSLERNDITKSNREHRYKDRHDGIHGGQGPRAQTLLEKVGDRGQSNPTIPDAREPVIGREKERNEK